MATKKTAAAAEVVNPEVALVQKEGSEILSFVGRLVPFLAKARELEVRALEALAKARTLVQPKNADEDAALKNEVRLWKTDTKEVEDHWEITTVFSRFHKRLTGRRGVAVDALKEAVRIATNHHEAFVRAEERRIFEEAERKRREDEARAQKQRDDELKALEQQALDAEAASEKLSEREQIFVDTYFANGGNGVKAATVAGYKDPFAQSSRLLQVEKIVAAIKGKQTAEAIRQQADAVKATPLETREIVVETQADTQGDRKSKSAQVLNEQAFIAAVVSGTYGIPLDCLTVKQTALNDYARKFGKLIDRWPGIRYVEKTSIV